MITILANLLSPIFLPMGVSQADLLYYLNLISGYLTVFIVSVVLLIVILIAAVKVKKGWKLFVRGEAIIVFLLVFVLVANGICYGPLYSTLSSYLNSSTVDLAEDTVAQSLEMIETIGEEGIVLAKNENLLPLSDETTKLNVFGWASISPYIGGTGSSASGAEATTDILQSLADAGYETNQTLTDLYTGYRSERPEITMSAQDLTLPEPTMDYYTDEIIEEAKKFSDIAVVVISRCGGEDFDLPTDMNAVINGTYDISEEISVAAENFNYLNAVYENNGDYDDFEEGESYLELSVTEERLIDMVCAEFSDVIIVVNACNTMELGWVDAYEQIKAVLLAPAPGASGFATLGKIFNGSVNPSGRTTDTYVKDLLSTPTIYNTGVHAYTNIEELTEEIAKEDSTYKGTVGFVNYVEGIYVGYKFYETASEEGLIDYEETVQYPFGYGLSYTTFEKTISSFKESEDSINIEVTVTNTGDVAGKDVVQLYYTPPYTNGGIEKASVNLIDFEKTQEIQPGKSEVISFTIEKEDMASYDSDGIKIEGGGYILEAGEYVISVRSDSHTIDDEKSFKIDQDIDYSEDGRSDDEVSATNQFEEYSRGNYTQLSRADGFANYEEACGTPLSEESYLMDDEMRAVVEANVVTGYDGSLYDNGEDEMPAMEADNGLELADLTGAEYDDERWELLLDQMSFSDMTTLVNTGAWQTAEIQSVGKIATQDCDGPAGLSNFLTGSYGTTYPCEVLMAQTWSKKIAYDIGVCIGSEFASAENYGWYGPAMNIHRSAFGGRNFEYYSEDGVLSGLFASEVILGSSQLGVYSYIKHFALNDQESMRAAILLTYVSEQAIREIYLKPFETVIKNYEGQSIAVMTSFNWIGTLPCCANSNLLNNVLRDEWGFEGMVISDYDGSYGYMISENSIRSGNDLMLGYGSYASNKLTDDSATLVLAMRQACKNILYTIANSGYYAEGSIIEYTNKMDPLFLKINVTAGVTLGVFEIVLLLVVFINRKRRRTDGRAAIDNMESSDGTGRKLKKK